MPPDAAAKLKSVDLGQHQVQDEEGWPVFLCVCDQILRPRWPVCAETAGVQMMRDQASDIFLVFHENDEFCRL